MDSLVGQAADHCTDFGSGRVCSIPVTGRTETDGPPHPAGSPPPGGIDLVGRVAIVTGASRGIGKAVALALADAGCDLALGAKTIKPHRKLPGTLPEVAAAVEARGRRALSIATDVRDPDAIHRLVEQTAATFGRIDILINNAGAAWWYPVEETPVRRFDLVMEVNARGPFLASQAVLPFMRKGGFGHIINMSPPIRTAMTGGRVAYMMSKFGMTLLTHGLADELGAGPIAINSLWPVTLIESQATAGLGVGKPADWRRADIMADAVLAMVRTNPAQRTGQALLDEEVLRAAGTTDFDHYACVPGTTPKRIPW